MTSSVIFAPLFFTFLHSFLVSPSSAVDVYAENPHKQQTVPVYRLPQRERREMQKEILSLLGLHRRPKVLPREGVRNSAPQYLLTLYRNQRESAAMDGDVFDHLSLFSPEIKSLPENHNNSFGINEDMSVVNGADVIMSFPNQPNKLRRQWSKRQIEHPRHKKQYFFFFDTSEVTREEEIIIAEMRIYKKKISGSGFFRLKLFKVLQNREGMTFSLVDAVTTTADFDGWITFQVTEALEVWVADAEQNLGLFLQLERTSDGSSIRPSDLGLVGTSPRRSSKTSYKKDAKVNGKDDRENDDEVEEERNESLRKPFMVVFFKKKVQLRVRRTRAARRNGSKQKYEGISADVAGRRPEVSREKRGKEKRASGKGNRRQQRRSDYKKDNYKDNYKDNINKWSGTSAGTPAGSRKAYNSAFDPRVRICKRELMHVSFRDLKWQDWIIAPEGYDSFFCFGECDFPLNAHMNATNHAIVQTLMHLNSHKKEIPKPCCAPTRTSAISVLYFDDNSNVILKKYNDMVVKACGCH